jgi:hypothetical protein
MYTYIQIQREKAGEVNAMTLLHRFELWPQPEHILHRNIHTYIIV